MWKGACATWCEAIQNPDGQRSEKTTQNVLGPGRIELQLQRERRGFVSRQL